MKQYICRMLRRGSVGGFTLVEMLVVVMILGILASVAIPNYMRSIEKSRATEAMNMVKSLNDAVYTYAAERNACPSAFYKLLIEVPGEISSDGAEIRSEYFSYRLNAAQNAKIPATNCGGVVAARLDGDVYYIWNPYGKSDSKRTLACYGESENAKKICKSMGLLTDVNL